MEKLRQSELLSGVRLCCLETDRFHTATFSAAFLRPLRREDAAKNALVMNVLARGCRACPDLQSLRAACQENYGASVLPELRQYGEVTALGFGAAFPDEAWLPKGSRELERVIRLVSDLCLDPDTRGGLLRSDYVQSERKNLRDRILAAVNDKRSYARIRAQALMCAEENYGVYPLGSPEDTEKLGHLPMTRHYQRLAASAPLRLFYCGSAPFEQVRDAVLSAFQMLSGTADRPMPETEIRDSAAVLRSETEYMNVEQGNLVLGCRLGGAVEPQEQPVLEVFNRLYGGGSPASRLFREVREKRSLCYSISTSYDRHKAVFFVTAGIAFDKRDEVAEAVLQELDRVRMGDFTAEDLETARSAAANAYRMIGDGSGSLDGYYLGQELLGSAARPQELAALALEVSPSDLCRMAERVQPELLYFLRGGEEART